MRLVAIVSTVFVPSALGESLRNYHESLLPLRSVKGVAVFDVEGVERGNSL